MFKSVVVITPTTCDPKVIDAIESVNNQTYKNVKHLLVVDGKKFQKNLIQLETTLDINWPDGDLTTEFKNVEVLQLGTNTGGGGFYGHRIYAGTPHLVNEDYVFFLDQDNTYEPNHIESLVKALEINDKIWWGYSLRNIIDKDKNFLCKDDCESLGKWPVWNNSESFHVDTSAYAFKREFLIQVSQLWHSGYAGDRRFFNAIQGLGNFVCSGEYTLNYYLDGNPNSASPDFFLHGNQKQKEFYGILRQEFPWKGHVQ